MMAVYRVVDKETGQSVYEYRADQPIEWVGMAFDGFDHVQVDAPEPAVPPVYGGERNLTKRQFLDLFTAQEQDAILALFDGSAAGKRAKIYFDSVVIVHLDDPKTAELLGGLALLGGISEARIVEVMNG